MSSIAKSVKKFQRIVLGTIVGVMALSLALWGFMPGSSGKASGDAGVMFDNVKVTNQEFNDAKTRATCIQRMQVLPGAIRYAQQYRQYSGKEVSIEDLMRRMISSEDALYEVTWTNLVLLHDAKAKGVTVTDDEAEAKIKELSAAYFHETTPDDESYGLFFKQILGIDQSLANTAAKESIAIEKLLDLVAAAEFPSYEKIYNDITGQNWLAKMQYVGFDPKQYLRESKQPTEEQIVAYFSGKDKRTQKENKEQFKVPPKVHLTYLFAAVDEFKKNVADPTDAEISAYYDQHKNDFLVRKPEKKDEHGHEHESEEPKQDTPQDYQPLKDVRDKVIEGFKNEKAAKLTYDVMRDVQKAIGAQQKPGVTLPVDIFDQIKEEFHKNNKPIRNDVTVALDRKNAPELIAKEIGKFMSADWLDWAFNSDRKEGDITPPPKTILEVRQESNTNQIRGYLIFKVQKKSDAYIPGLNAEIRERIAKTLVKEQLQKRAKDAAAKLSQDINLHGLAYARQKYNVEFKSTKYFKVNDAHQTGVEDAALGEELRKEANRLKGETAKLGPSTVIDGSSLGTEKHDWAYVAYLEDAVLQAPEKEDEQFNKNRKTEAEQIRSKAKNDYVKALKEAAKIQDFTGKLKSGATTPTGDQGHQHDHDDD